MHTPGYSSAKDGLDGSPLTLCSSFLISFLLFLSTDLILSKLLQFSLSGSAIQSAYLLGPPWLNMEVWNSKLNAYLFLLRHHFAKKIERFDPKTCLRKTEQSETCLKMWEVQDILFISEMHLKYEMSDETAEWVLICYPRWHLISESNIIYTRPSDISCSCLQSHMFQSKYWIY